MTQTNPALHPSETWNRPEFIDYYTRLHASPEMAAKVETLYRTIAAVLGDRADSALDVADVGCGPGLQSLIWARHGHRVTGIDISDAFIASARARAEAEGNAARYEVGSATALPLETASQDVCPVQHEFDLPLYSWYPPRLKRHYEHLARTTRPEIANYATFPAVNWFSFYAMRRYLGEHGFDRILDRFDMAACRGSGALRDAVIRAIRLLPPLRFLGHVASPPMVVCAFRAR